MRRLLLILMFAGVWAGSAHAEVYAYENEQGQYVVAPQKPSNPMTEYSVLTDDGKFVRLVSPAQAARQNRIPIDHWRPWFIPKEPHPLERTDTRHRAGPERQPLRRSKTRAAIDAVSTSR